MLNHENKVFLTIGTIAFMLLSSVAFCDDDSDEQDSKPGIITISKEQIENEGIEVRQGAPGTLFIITPVPARITINDNQHAHVVAKVPGIVVEVKKNIGEEVKKGEVLAILESREIAEAKASYLYALKQDVLIKQLLNCEEELKLMKVSSQRDYLQVAAEARDAQIDLELTKQKLQILGLEQDEILAITLNDTDNLRNYTLKAPIDGVITERNLVRGEWLSNENEAYSIANLDTVWVDIGIHAKDLPAIKQGQKINISTLSGNKTAQAEVAYLNRIIDEQTKTAKAIAVMDNSAGEWMPGTFVCACIITSQFEVALAVPKDSVHQIDEDECIFIPVEGGFEKICVKTGRKDAVNIEIIDGLNAGAPYAATNTFLLKADLGKASAKED